MNILAGPRALALVVLAVGAAPIAAAAPKDPADLFPSNAIAYAELTNPAELAPQLASVFEGTSIADSITSIHKRKDAATTLGELNGKREIAGLGLLASPEMAAEFRKLQGVAAGVTGFTSAGEPEMVVVVLTGDSPAAGLAARAFLTMTPSLRRVGEVSRVPVFQYRFPEINYDNMGTPILANTKPLAENPREVAFAYTPGLFVMGTGKKAVGHAIRRFLGEEKTTLSDTAAFKDAAKTHRRTGVFFFVNARELSARIADVDKALGGQGELETYAWFAMLVDPKAVQSLAGNVHFRDGGLAIAVAAAINPEVKSPLGDLLSGADVKLDYLNGVRRTSTLAIAVSLPEKDRAARLIGLFDAITKATGELGRLPGEAVKEMEAKYKVSVTGLVSKIQGLTLIVPSKQELPKDARPFPMLVIHAADEEAATAWEDFFPKLFADLGGQAEVPQTSSQDIAGRKVYSLPGNGLPWNGPVHFARNGRTLAVGLDRKLVAAAVSPDPAAAAATVEVFRPLAATPGPVMAGTVTLGDVIAAILDRPRQGGMVVPVEEVQRFVGGNPASEKMIEETKKARAEFFATMAAIPPTAFTVRRAGNELHIDLFQPKVQNGGLKTVIDSGANWLDKWGSLSNQSPFQPGFDR